MKTAFFMKHLLLATILVSILFGLTCQLRAQIGERNLSNDLRTPAERTDFRATPRYPEIISYSKKLDAASDDIVLEYIGNSSEGRKIPLLIATKGRVHLKKQSPKQKKLVVLIQAGIHAGEPDGKDAGFQLFKEIAKGEKAHQNLLEKSVLLFVPILNPDGHELFSKFNRINQNGPEESGFRANSANLNLNRDYMKADTPEIRAWLKLWNKWNPDFFIDCHVTDGADYQYNVTFEYSHHAEMNRNLVEWMKTSFENETVPKINSRGNLIHRYIQVIDRRDLSKGIATFIATPRFATGYTALRNRIGLLVEAHSLKDFRTRVKGTYDLLVETLQMLDRESRVLRSLNEKADATYKTKARKIALRQRISREAKTINFKGLDFELFDSEITGVKEIRYTKTPRNFKIPQYDSAETTLEKSVPEMFVVPPQWQNVIEVLEAHGVPIKRLERPITIEVESYKFEKPRWRSFPFEGRFLLSAKAIPTRAQRKLAKNSAIISTRNPFWMVATHFLEPQGPDSAFSWGFFDAIFERKEYAESYIIEEIAKKMLSDNPKLRAEFEAKLKDEAFENNPRARVNFFYERSEYYDPRIAVYPVSKISDMGSLRTVNENIIR